MTSERDASKRQWAQMPAPDLYESEVEDDGDTAHNIDWAKFDGRPIDDETVGGDNAVDDDRTRSCCDPSTSGEWEELEINIDCGATENVTGEESLRGVPLRNGPAFERGAKYEVANGAQIPTAAKRSSLDIYLKEISEQ